MVINWYGEGCFRIQSGGTVILVDPFESGGGLTPPRGKADIVLYTFTPLPLPYRPGGEARELWGPGEYEARGFEVTGIPLPYESGANGFRTVFRLLAEELRFALLGHVGAFHEELIDRLGDIDVLVIPAGGAPFLDAAGAAKFVKQVNPKIVIPSFFKTPGLKRKAGDLAEFLAEIGQKGVVPEEKIVLRKKELPTTTKVVVLKP